jgi:hypothetical protein
MMFERAKIAVFVLFAACSVGEVPSGGGDGGGMGGGQSFEAMIKPLVGGSPARCTGCHMLNQPPTLSSFSALEMKYKMGPGNTNILVTKGNHAGITNYFNATEQMTVASWIDSL